MSVVLEKWIHDNLILIPGGNEIMRHFYDEQKWISSNSKMSVPGRRNDLTETQSIIEIKPFSLFRFPVTDDLFHFVTGASENIRDTGIPAVNVSWNDAIRFCNALSVLVGRKPYYTFDRYTEEVSCHPESEGFRLPTEAEWQYACHAGSHPYQYGNIHEIAWFDTNSNHQIQAVGKKAPNEWDLYNMLGNVWEWCWDLYDEKRYDTYRSFRGGSWAGTERVCGATCRRKGHPSFKIDDLGFRIAK